MAQLVDLVNVALSNLGAETIDALTPEDSPQAAIAVNLAQPAVDAFLAKGEWRFAVKTLQLSRIAGDTPTASPWRYQFAIPVDCLRVISTTAPNQDWEEASHHLDQRRVIYANETDLSADMVVRIEVALFPAHVREAAEYAMTARLAMPVTRSSDIASYWEKLAGVALSAAKTQDWNERPWPEIEGGNVFADARFGI